MSTPPSLRASTFSTLPPPSPLSIPFEQIPDSNAMDVPAQEDPLAGVPELKSYVTTDEDERIAGLKLVADGVAQMRQAANNFLIFHPLNFAGVVAIFPSIIAFMWRPN